MGYALPAALAAALVHPDRPAVAVTGDGDLLMTAQELATAAHHGVSLLVVVVDNGVYGTIRTHQERQYPGRPFATALTNPDLVAFAHSFGAWASRAPTTAEAVALLDVAVTRPGLRVVVLATG
jgi:acetolactate synthase-1/2/3 large subunit